ncbi:hypothetical protein CK203_105673 [Vitis vinifera]|uniref:Uncharacterized protein n=1 Tax=Vitis vinifera TaxID=29760 RepID=A0A438DCQ6_VITVI|nr:hypothetical protein CK203_105673 [Vitis vinifera]
MQGMQGEHFSNDQSDIYIDYGELGNITGFQQYGQTMTTPWEEYPLDKFEKKLQPLRHIVIFIIMAISKQSKNVNYSYMLNTWDLTYFIGLGVKTLGSKGWSKIRRSGLSQSYLSLK